MTHTTTGPVLAEIETTTAGAAAVRLAAREADARRVPLRLFLTRPTTVWSNPVAMAPYRPSALADHGVVLRRARALVREVRAAHPDLDLRAGVVRDATATVRRASGRASLIVAHPRRREHGLLGRPGRRTAFACPVITVDDTNASVGA